MWSMKKQIFFSLLRCVLLAVFIARSSQLRKMHPMHVVILCESVYYLHTFFSTSMHASYTCICHEHIINNMTSINCFAVVMRQSEVGPIACAVRQNLSVERRKKNEKKQIRETRHSYEMMD